MEHKDFCEHYCEMTDKEIAADVHKSINSFLKKRAEGDDFGSKMVRRALERINATQKSAKNAANARWNKGDATTREDVDETDRTTVYGSPSVQITPGILAAISDREGQPTQAEEGGKAPLFSPSPSSACKSVPLPHNKQEVIEFALDNGLDTDDASTWAEINLKERKGKDKDGKPLKNWKGACINYCRAEELKRSKSA